MTALCLPVMKRKTFIIDSNGISDRMLLMGIKASRSNQLMVESNASAFAKGLLGRNNKTFIGLSRT